MKFLDHHSIPARPGERSAYLVNGESGDYSVILFPNGRYWCSCPKFKFTPRDSNGDREACKHIRYIQDQIKPPTILTIHKAAGGRNLITIHIAGKKFTHTYVDVVEDLR